MLLQLLDGETIRDWLEPVYMYSDGTGYALPWELFPLGNYTWHTKAGVLNGYNAEFQMAVSEGLGGLRYRLPYYIQYYGFDDQLAISELRLRSYGTSIYFTQYFVSLLVS